MQNAPAVSYPVGRLHIRVALAAVLLLGASAIALWYFQADHPGWRQALALCVWLLCAGLALFAENLPGNGGVLRWDGQNWTWLAVRGMWGDGQLECPAPCAMGAGPCGIRATGGTRRIGWR
jgi:hypothetical protein